MRILHVFSADFLAGSVFYAIHLAERHTAEGHQVFLVSDNDELPTSVPQFALPISNRRHVQRIKNIRFLKKFIKENHIQVLHAHSRAASWVSYFAVLGTKIPLISTVHGRQHIHTSVQLFDIYGDKVIAICENLQHHLINEVKMKPEKITLLANGFNFDKLSSYTQAFHLQIHTFEESKEDKQKSIIISFIGRHNGGKGEIITHLLDIVFPNLLKNHKNLIVNLIGGELKELPEKGQQLFHALNQQFEQRVKSIGFVNDVHTWIRNSTVVISAGRVAIEALYLDTPVLALGEATSHGIVHERNLQECLASNFGDILPTKAAHKHDYTKILEDLEFEIRNVSESKPFNLEAKTSNTQSILNARYDIENIADQILKIYQSESIKKVSPKFIPILMYHKIPDAPIDSPNKIFVTEKDFEKHLRFFKLRGLSPITFKDYWAFRRGERAMKDFPKKPIILTFDDGYVDNYTNLLPLMEKYGYKGVIYLLGDFEVTYNYWDADKGDHRDEIMTKAQKKVFVEKGWEIGSHTLTHRHLTQLSEKEAFDEIVKSKTNLEKELETQIISFAYPYGDVNEKVKELTKQSGHFLGIATDSGGMDIEEDLFQVFRINIFPNESLFQLYKKTSSWYRKYYKRKRGK